jgi:hypothetical protein
MGRLNEATWKEQVQLGMDEHSRYRGMDVKKEREAKTRRDKIRELIQPKELMASRVDRTQDLPNRNEWNYWPPTPCSASFPPHNPKNTPALDTMSTALPTIVVLSETTPVVGDDNPLELP